jgi:ankyrin repeat protein
MPWLNCRILSPTIVEFLAIVHPQDVQSRGVLDHSTPLHLASQQGNAEVARILVEYGADVSAKNKERVDSAAFGVASWSRGSRALPHRARRRRVSQR